MESWCENLPRKLLNRLGCCRYPCIHSKSCIAMASYHSPFTKSPILYSPHTHRTFPQTLLQASTSSPRHPHSTATHCDATSALNCAPAHRPRITPPRPAPPRTPSNCPSHGPSHVAVTTTTIPVTAIAAAASTSEAPCISAHGTATMCRRRFQKCRNAPWDHVEGFGQ